MSLILVLDQGTSQVFESIKDYCKKVLFPLRITCDLKIPIYMEERGLRKREGYVKEFSLNFGNPAGFNKGKHRCKCPQANHPSPH